MTDEAAPPAAAIDDWIGRGRFLASERQQYDWALADWMAHGKSAGHLTHLKFTYLSQILGITTRRLKDALKAATTFPVGRREPRVSIEHHVAVASLPDEKALPLLRRAWEERLPAQALREAAAQHRLETGERFEDEDTDTSLATVQIRAWNRATPEARALAFEHFRIAAANGHRIVDEDEAVDG